MTLFSTPLVVYRNADGQIGALLDRCSHRNVPLSLGKVKKKTRRRSQRANDTDDVVTAEGLRLAAPDIIPERQRQSTNSFYYDHAVLVFDPKLG